jgi:putative transposase
VFFNLLKRYLCHKPEKDNFGRLYASLSEEIDLMCYCLMSNHFHLLCYQIEEGSMTKLMRCVLSSYSKYFNNKYGLSGSVFETTYKASVIDSDQYLLHISRYVHSNPDEWDDYKYSSIKYYLGKPPPDWLKTKRIKSLFDNQNEYINFLRDNLDQKQSYKMIKSSLADK